MVASAVAAYIIADMDDPAEGKKWAERRLQVARRLDAKLFVAIGFEYLTNFSAQEGKQVEADSLVREALATLRQTESGMRFVGPRTLGILARISSNKREKRAALDEAHELLREGLLSQNYILLYRDAMEIFLESGEWDTVETYARMLEDYTRDQPLPWTEFVVARGRALATIGCGNKNQSTRQEIERLRNKAKELRMGTALPAIERAVDIAS